MKELNSLFLCATALVVAATAAALTLAHAQDAAAPRQAAAEAKQGAAPQKYECTAPSELTRLDYALKRVSQRVAAAMPVKIVAIGSSSTAGAGASAPELSYPARLQVELQELMPRVPVTVINRGANGEESRDMLARFERDVFAEKPDLVLWQAGSNSVLRDRPLSEAPPILNQGLKLLSEHGADVVLVNPQYAPKVITRHDVEGMVHLMAVTAKEKSVNLFQRFAVMRYWQLTEGIPFNSFLSPDELHLNDWSYGCIARLLGGAIHDAATRPTMTATAGARQ
jgi:lysophospholipase L1-like esterase